MSRLLSEDTRQIVTGARYVEQITASKSDRLARSAFRDLVLRIAPPGTTLLDFGSGTGMDARFYAEHGFNVAAYDVDPQMCDFFAEHCRDLMETGQVRLERGEYRDFLANSKSGGGGRSVELVTSNFAPFNLIADLQELFEAFYALTAPGGRVLASVLSPYFVGDLKYGWWWRNSLRLCRAGHYCVPGVQAPIVRRRLDNFAAQSAPYFTLKRVFRGLPPTGDSADAADAGVDMTRKVIAPGLRVVTCRFMFLLFERQHLGSDHRS